MVTMGHHGKLLRNKYDLKYYVIVLLIGITACKSDPNANSTIQTEPREIIQSVKVPKVSTDSLMVFTQTQLSFGNRVPGSDGSQMTKNWLKQKMTSYGARVTEQPFMADFLDKKDVQCHNIIAQINPDSKKRIILFAHFDSRLIAEKDPDNNRLKDPIPGAIDGATGTAGLVEIARLLHENPINLGVDFVFFDAEDQGQGNDNWCIGSKYWASNQKNLSHKPEFGILLDLIGGKGSTYGFEAYSMQYARDILIKVWSLASLMGKKDIFQVYDGGPIMDDHYYVNTIANIPTIDIIHTTQNGGFGSYHHTHSDNMEAIDPSIFNGVIQVVTAVVYKVYDNSFYTIENILN